MQLEALEQNPWDGKSPVCNQGLLWACSDAEHHSICPECCIYKACSLSLLVDSGRSIRLMLLSSFPGVGG